MFELKHKGQQRDPKSADKIWSHYVQYNLRKWDKTICWTKRDWQTNRQIDGQGECNIDPSLYS